MADHSDEIAGIRAFNRFYTRLVGALDAGLLETPYSLSEARFIYEIATRGSTSAAELSRVLKVDPGYTSRLMAKLVDAGIVAIVPSGTDARRNDIALTREGDAAFRLLDSASDASVEALIEPLSAPRRSAMLSAMADIRRAFGDEPDAAPVRLRAPLVGELGWLVHRQAVLYHEEQGWNADFEGLIAKLYGDYQAMPEAPPKRLWIAELGGAVAGSIYVVPAAGRPGVAQLRMLYVEPFARGRGIGQQLVDAVIGFSRVSGYSKVILWTQSALVSARRIYDAAGFRLVSEEAHFSFGAELVGQYLELDLGSEAQ
jgi:DNA-binding MarR family transcriptional regulator/ribosomal protein S18 acetylase RimI-like enzyme